MLIVEVRHLFELEVFGKRPEEFLEREFVLVGIGYSHSDEVVVLDA